MQDFLALFFNSWEYKALVAIFWLLVYWFFLRFLKFIFEGLKDTKEDKKLDKELEDFIE